MSLNKGNNQKCKEKVNGHSQKCEDNATGTVGNVRVRQGDGEKYKDKAKGTVRNVRIKRRAQAEKGV